MRYVRKGLKAGLISWLLFLVVWQLVAMNSNPDYFPTPIQTLQGAVELLNDNSLISYVLISFKRVVLGWLLGSLLGIPAGLLIGRFRWLRELVEPYLNFFRFIPALAFITLFILWFGIGEQSKIILIMYATLFIVVLNTAAGVVNVEDDKIRSARSLGASERQILIHVIIPAVVPAFFNGVRLAMGNSFMAIVGAEMIAANEGVGYLIWTSRLYSKTDWIFVGLLLLGLMGFAGDQLLRWMGKTTLGRYGIAKETRFGK
ncbi:ABC transporter permease [Paenibacillus durus]|uniref:Nitrate ABC transporter permease n=1 Tax=Paenibacillus durus ATCC 35681 TaxID=1333534 RepID=A0A0F7FEU0_PAEDU|nr:ABC transporter permease [Paenibacillus durus]AKG37075.1 nitrate ABC transporter permease [Paenibacillus durus ATCC 35681]